MTAATRKLLVLDQDETLPEKWAGSWKHVPKLGREG
jgi:hypothetical protein